MVIVVSTVHVMRADCILFNIRKNVAYSSCLWCPAVQPKVVFPLPASSCITNFATECCHKHSRLHTGCTPCRVTKKEMWA